MSFLDNLRDYLQELSHAPEPPGAVAETIIDAATARSQLIRVLERIERQEREEASKPASPQKGLPRSEQLLSTWQRDDRIVRFARRMNQLLRQSIGKEASAREMELWIQVAIARQLGLPDELDSRIRTREVDRLAEIAFEEVFGSSTSRQSIDVGAYATAIRATRGAPPRLSLTPIGRVFLELTGRDAIRWLLQVEVAQSTGPADPARLSRETAHALTQKTDWVFDWGESVDFPHSWDTLARLEALGLLSIVTVDEAEKTFLEVLPLGRSLLAEIARENETPMSVLANSLLADLTLSAADAVARPDKGAADPHASAAAEATARQARLSSPTSCATSSSPSRRPWGRSTERFFSRPPAKSSPDGGRASIEASTRPSASSISSSSSRRSPQPRLSRLTRLPPSARRWPSSRPRQDGASRRTFQRRFPLSPGTARVSCSPSPTSCGTRLRWSIPRTPSFAFRHNPSKEHVPCSSP
jgi:hypothetical protein